MFSIALRARGSSTDQSQHALTLGAVQAFLGTSAPTSLLIPLSRTQPCPLYHHPIPWHSWRRHADVWKRFPNPPNKGKVLFFTILFSFFGLKQCIPCLGLMFECM